jgi:hypothetical protein
MRRKIVGLILVTIYLISCKPNYIKQNNQDLECIIDTYKSIFSTKIGAELSLFESHGWTDTTIHLSISTIKSTRLSSGKWFYSEYSGVKLFLSQGRLYQDSTGSQLELFTNEKMMLPNSLKWKTIELNNLEEEFFPPEEFDEVQIVYNIIKKCVEEPKMIALDEFNVLLKSRCDLCK